MAKLYNQDGTGRDSYIFFNNGGFYPAEQRLLQKDQQINWAYGSPVNQKTSYKLTKRQFYKSDGTGRDTYVITNVQDRIVFEPEFSTKLRSYVSPGHSPRFPYKLPPLKQSQMNKLAQSQKLLNDSLSVPKFKKTKKFETNYNTQPDA